ncbi:MAG: HAMP domain-containing sensor histidine kinase [Acidobacteriota bacterium]
MSTDSDQKLASPEPSGGEDEVERPDRRGAPSPDFEGDRRRPGTENARQRSEMGRLERLIEQQAKELLSAHEELDLKDEFLAIVSHDLRNPLNAIALNTQLLERLNRSRDPHLAGISRSLDSSIAQMKRIISDLLDLAAIEAGKLSVRLQPGDARKPIEEAVESFRSARAERFDAGRVVQVLDNLIHNAFKFTPNGGRIVVEGRKAEQVEILVRDSGPGLTAEEISVIFERFRQVEKRGRRALGLGLYISRSIVESHGGRIRAESVPGEGSTFFFTLPPE